MQKFRSTLFGKLLRWNHFSQSSKKLHRPNGRPNWNWMHQRVCIWSAIQSNFLCVLDFKELRKHSFFDIILSCSRMKSIPDYGLPDVASLPALIMAKMIMGLSSFLLSMPPRSYKESTRFSVKLPETRCTIC